MRSASRPGRLNEFSRSWIVLNKSSFHGYSHLSEWWFFWALFLIRLSNLFLPNFQSISAASAGVLSLKLKWGFTKLWIMRLRFRKASAFLKFLNSPRIILSLSLISPLYLSIGLLLWFNPADFALIGTPKWSVATLKNNLLNAPL